jgi:hypothetical protein
MAVSHVASSLRCTRCFRRTKRGNSQPAQKNRRCDRSFAGSGARRIMRAGAHHRPSVRLSILETTSAFSADLCLAPSRVYFTSAALGGEHTITLALLRALAKKRGPVGLGFSMRMSIHRKKSSGAARFKSAFVLRFRKTCSMAVEP